MIELFKGFSKLNKQQRLDLLAKLHLLKKEDISKLKRQPDEMVALAEHFIENVLGIYEMPYGVAVNFKIDNKNYVIPMAIEETSIIAAASKAAKWISQKGHIKTRMEQAELVGQIYFPNVADLKNFSQSILQSKASLIKQVNNSVAASMCLRGGGVKDIIVRNLTVKNHATKVAVHVLIDTCDAMGANIINQVCETLRAPLEQITSEKALLCILSNYSEAKLAHATIEVRDIEPELGSAIEEASVFATIDPYRATTNNKGILNAIDAIAIATGNDWRAINAGMHAYAASSGQYKSLTQWKYKNNCLYGELKAPIVVGIVGGVTNLHPIAQMSLKILGVTSAEELSRIMAAVGLVQNLAAIKALVTEGIVNGHMRLHIDNILLCIDSTHEEKDILKERLQRLLKETKKVSVTDAKKILGEMRTGLYGNG